MTDEVQAVEELISALRKDLFSSSYSPAPTEIRIVTEPPKPDLHFQLKNLKLATADLEDTLGSEREEPTKIYRAAANIHTPPKSKDLRGSFEFGPELVYLLPGLEEANGVIAETNALTGASFTDWDKKDIGAFGVRGVYWLSDHLGLTVQVSYSAGNIAQQEAILNPQVGRLDVRVKPEYDSVIRAETGLIAFPFEVRGVKIGFGGGLDFSDVSAQYALDVDALDFPAASSSIRSSLDGSGFGSWVAALVRAPAGKRGSIWGQVGYNFDKVDTAGTTTQTSALGSVTTPETLKTELDGLRIVLGYHHTLKR